MLLQVYQWVIVAMAVVAGAIVAAIFFAVIYDVSLRNFGFQPPLWTVPLSEIGLLYITLLAAPWLLHTRGQIVVESLRLVMPQRVRRVIEICVYVLCLCVCLVLAWYAIDQTIETWQRNEVENRGIEVPIAFSFAPMVVSFVLMGCEFLRLLICRDTLYDQSAVKREGI